MECVGRRRRVRTSFTLRLKLRRWIDKHCHSVDEHCSSDQRHAANGNRDHSLSPYLRNDQAARVRNVENEGTPATLPVSVDPLIGDPYVSSTSSPAALSTGGTAMAMNCDDCFKSRILPFVFPF